MVGTTTRRRALTLAELTVSMAVSVVLLGGLASALVISSHAMPDGDSLARGLLDGATAAEQIAADLLCARSFTEVSSTAVEFTVADRNHGPDGPETIRYAWSQTAGDPLTRQYNGGAPANILDGVNEFALTYDLETTGESAPPTPGEEFPFRQIVDYTLDTGIAEQEYAVSTSTWCGEYISPDPSTLPAETAQWRLDNMSFRLKKLGNGPQSGNMTAVQLRTANADRTPGSTVIDELLIDEGTLDSKNWTMIFWTPSGAPWIGPTEGLCIVIKPVSQPDTCRVLFQATAIPSGNVSFLQSTDAGASFSVHNSETMTGFSVSATAKTSAGATASSTSLLRRVTIGIRVGDAPSAFVETATEVLNQPEVTGP